MSAGYPCPNCGTQLSWVARYNQYYCGRCQRYIPASAPVVLAATNPVDDFFGGISRDLGVQTTPCPTCGRGAAFNRQYNRWYCPYCQNWL